MKTLGVKFNTTPSKLPDSVKYSQFGCVNCLWQSCECQQGSMYKVKSEKDINCGAYTYYD